MLLDVLKLVAIDKHDRKLAKLRLKVVAAEARHFGQQDRADLLAIDKDRGDGLVQTIG